MRIARNVVIILAVAAFITGAVTSGVLNADYYIGLSEINRRFAAEAGRPTPDGFWNKFPQVDRTRSYVNTSLRRTAALQQGVQALEQQNDSLEGALGQQREESEQLNQALAQQKEQLRTVQAEMRSLKSTVGSLEGSNRQLQQSLLQLQRQLAQQERETMLAKRPHYHQPPSQSEYRRRMAKPRESPTKVIFIHGIASKSSCADSSLSFPIQKIKDALHRYPPVSTPPLNDQDIIGFSYSGEYNDCALGKMYITSHQVSWPASPPMPLYARSAPCTGVKNASQHLEQLVSSLLEKQPEARIVLIGYSLGGMVAAYYVSQQPASFVQEHIQRVVTIDSPLLSYPFWDMTSCTAHKSNRGISGYGQSWQDVFGNSGVVPAIAGIKDPRVLSRFMTLRSTNVGDRLKDPAETVDLSCGVNLFWLIPFVWLIPLGHDCAFSDPEGQAAIARAVHGAPPVTG